MDKRDIAADYRRERAAQRELEARQAPAEQQTEPDAAPERADEAAPEAAVEPKPRRRSRSSRDGVNTEADRDQPE